MTNIVCINPKRRGEFIYLLSRYLKSDSVRFEPNAGETFDVIIDNDVPVIAKFHNGTEEAALKIECGGSFLLLDRTEFSAISCF